MKGLLRRRSCFEMCIHPQMKSSVRLRTNFFVVHIFLHPCFFSLSLPHIVPFFLSFLSSKKDFWGRKERKSVTRMVPSYKLLDQHAGSVFLIWFNFTFQDCKWETREVTLDCLSRKVVFVRNSFSPNFWAEVTNIQLLTLTLFPTLW